MAKFSPRPCEKSMIALQQRADMYHTLGTRKDLAVGYCYYYYILSSPIHIHVCSRKWPLAFTYYGKHASKVSDIYFQKL